MSLSDVVGNAGLGHWAEIALLIFFAAFLGIVLYVALRRRGAWEQARHLPLDDDSRNGSLEDSSR